MNVPDWIVVILVAVLAFLAGIAQRPPVCNVCILIKRVNDDDDEEPGAIIEGDEWKHSAGDNL